MSSGTLHALEGSFSSKPRAPSCLSGQGPHTQLRALPTITPSSLTLTVWRTVGKGQGSKVGCSVSPDTCPLGSWLGGVAGGLEQHCRPCTCRHTPPPLWNAIPHRLHLSSNYRPETSLFPINAGKQKLRIHLLHSWWKMQSGLGVPDTPTSSMQPSAKSGEGVRHG